MKINKIKGIYKFFSLLLTVVMLNSLLWVSSVSAKPQHEMTDYTLASHGCSTGSATTYQFPSLNGGVKADVRGFGGKAENDLSIKLTSANANAKPYLQAAVNATYHPMLTDTNNLYVCSFNVYPVNGVDLVKIATNQTRPIAREIPGNALVPKRWNRIVCVYDRNAGNGYGTNTLYLNGKPYGTPYPLTETDFSKLGNNYADITQELKSVTYRVELTLAAAADMYFDDFIIWKVPRTVTPYTALPQVSGDIVFGNTIVSGTTPAQVQAAAVSELGNPITVKAYRGSDMTAEPLGADTPLKNGDTILLEEKLLYSETTSDAAPDGIRMAYKYYQVTDDDKLLLYDLEESGHYSVIRGTQTKNVDGFYGKPAEEKVLRVAQRTAEDAASYIESTTSDSAYEASGKWPIVFECDFLPESHVANVYFSTGGGPYLTKLYPGNNDVHSESNSSSGNEKTTGFLHGRWSKLKLVANYQTNTLTTYINGVKAGEDPLTPGTNAYNNLKSQVRLVVNWDDSEAAASKKTFCVDNFRVYEWKNPNPEADAIALTGIADSYLRQGDKISFFGGKITDDTKNEMGVHDAWAFGSESSYTPIAEGNSLSDDNLVVLRNAAGSYGYYTVREHLLAAGGEGYINDTMYTDGDLNFTATGGGTMILAQYDGAGRLLKAQAHTLSDQKEVVKLAHEDGTVSVKAMVWEDMQNISPYVESVELGYNPNYSKENEKLSILMVGNSFSEDMSHYLRDIAAQNGENVTIGILNKGGASAAWHAERMETEDPRIEGIGFTYNGVTSSFINLKKALSDYDWDIVILQNWSGAAWEYDGSSDAYNREWKEPFTTLANYVKTNEPGARIMIQETWAYEQGYKNTNHAEMSAQNQRVYNLIVEDLQETLGYKPQVISSRGIFDVAIAYQKNGVQIFNTTYDASKHQFAGGKDYYVNDGSCLLSDADVAAGKITLHRDGFHAGHVGRYLLAANAYATIFNKPVSGNPFCPGTMRYAVGAVDLTDGSAAFLNYDSLDKDVVKMLQEVVDGFHADEYMQPTIACWGDSLTYGQGSTNRSVNSYPAVLEKKSGLTVYNMGIGGETATTIAARQGALNIQISEPVTIPQSGSVEVKFKASNGGVVTPRVTSIAGWSPCSINGVQGTLSVQIDETVWPRVLASAAFTRETPGDSIEVAEGDELIPQGHSVRADINVIFSGTNGGWSPKNLTTDASHNDDEEIRSMVDLLKRQAQMSNNSDKYVIIGLTTQDDKFWEKYHAALQAEFGNQFFNLRKSLQSADLLRDYGLTPTADDITAIEETKTPPSILVSDGVHFNDTGYEIIGNLLYKKLQELGYIK